MEFIKQSYSQRSCRMNVIPCAVLIYLGSGLEQYVAGEVSGVQPLLSSLELKEKGTNILQLFFRFHFLSNELVLLVET